MHTHQTSPPPMEEKPAVIESPPVVDPVKSSEPVKEVKVEPSVTTTSQEEDSTRVSSPMLVLS